MILQRQDFLLNAFASYVRQTTIATKGAVLEAYKENPDIVDALLRYFDAKFNPETHNASNLAKIDAEITENMPKSVALKAVFSILKAMLRTNFYQGNKNYASFKFASEQIHGLPKPVPMAEMFVYSDAVDAIHLRFGKIARGGIRWSDRKEDFRTEVLSLVKAQQVKNVVIVPVGSKGGFYPKNPPVGATKAPLVKNAIECYKTMIRGFLDITDNIIDGKIVPPTDVVRYDNDDPYLVVAADKGTADFSDIANSLSAEYGFWLSDAFASGGSAGYSHKGMAITARGSWESVKRHFREIGIDCQKQNFTTIGVGSMAGDVFGNAMLCSVEIKLIAAVNSVSIFIDPTPDTKTSFAERKRLFDAEAGWTEYDLKKLSNGGAVYSRKEKSITISAEAQKALGVSQATFTPDELVKVILKAPVDLLYFGGIGTYVKASTESQMNARDSANAGCRIDAPQVRAKIVAEGANLGLTQKARIEYALNGGRLNTDALDNSGGVDCSDHEVNIKIMLNTAVSDGVLTLPKRNEILKSMTLDVADLVLKDNYQQTGIISYMIYRGAKSIPGNKKLMNKLEKAGKLDRAIEFLPTDAEMDARFNQNACLTRPEMCIVLAYAKMALYEDILNSDLPDDEALAQGTLLSYFPKRLQTDFTKYVLAHRLSHEIIATVVTNNLINRVGVNFIGKMQNENANASVSQVAKAYLIVQKALKTEELFSLIEAQDNKIPADTQSAFARRLISEIENMTLTILRQGMEDEIEKEAEKLASREGTKLDTLRTELVK